MPPPQTSSGSKYDVVIDPSGTSPIYLLFDRQRTNGKPFEFSVEYVPVQGGSASSVPIQQWEWRNGKEGAGWGIETEQSYRGGGSAYGTFVWLRKLGVAQPAGVLTEVTVPATTSTFRDGSFTAALEWGTAGDLFLTTRNRTVVRIVGGTAAPTEEVFGATAETVGIAGFDVGGSPRLYVADSQLPLHIWNGTAWSAGGSGTEREWLATVQWTIGESLATTGAAGTAGTPASRLLGTKTDGTGFYHVSGDPATAANWSSLTLIRPTHDTILKMVTSNRHAYFGKPSGIYDCDEVGNTPNLTKGIELAASTNNFRQLAFWNGMIWGAHDLGLMAFTPDGSRVDLPQFVTFGAGASNHSPIWGRPRALGVAPQGLYVGFYDNADSYIGLLMLDPDGSYRWSMAEAVIEDEQITLIHQASPGGNPRVWYGTVDQSGAYHLYWQSQPLTGDPDLDVVHGGPFVPAQDWTIRLSRTNNGTTDQKTYRRLMVEADRLGSTYPANYVDFRIATDGGSFASQGTATTEARWSAAPASGNIRSTNIQVELAVHNASNAPVVVHSVGLQYNPHPELTQVWNLPVIFGRNATNQDPRVARVLLDQCQDRGPLTVELMGYTVEALVEPRNRHRWVEGSDKVWTVHSDIQMTVTASPALWDEGLYDIDVFS